MDPTQAFNGFIDAEIALGVFLICVPVTVFAQIIFSEGSSATRKPNFAQLPVCFSPLYLMYRFQHVICGLKLFEPLLAWLSAQVDK